jgi:hypothetical protein
MAGTDLLAYLILALTWLAIARASYQIGKSQSVLGALWSGLAGMVDPIYGFQLVRAARHSQDQELPDA